MQRFEVQSSGRNSIGPSCRVFLAVAFAPLFTAAGCSSDSRIAVTGAVTLDGKPLESAAISFRPAPGNTSNSSGGQIERGEFHLAANHGLCPGKYFVTVQTFKPTGRMIVIHETKVPEQAAIKFNEDGKLEANVTAGNENHFDFRLTSACADAH